MRSSTARSVAWWAAVSLSLAFGACGKAPDAPGPMARAESDGASGPATASRSPIGIVPAAEGTAGSGVPGPGAGATAIGGVAGQQDAGGAVASHGSTPAPTGGDGAASTPRTP